MRIYTYVYIYIYIYVCTHLYKYIYIYILSSAHRRPSRSPTLASDPSRCYGMLYHSMLRPISLLTLHPTNIARVKLSGKSPLGLRIPPL